MIKIDYQYKSKLSTTWKSAFSIFEDINKAVRFVYVIVNSKDKVYMGFSCDDLEELEEMQRRLG